MLGRWKKFLGVFLAFAMVIAMMTGNTLRVSAAGENEISSVTITALPEIVAGGTIAEANVTVEVPEGATAETKWEVWGTVEVEDEEGDSYEDWVEVTDDTFSATEVYRCFVVFTAQEGYSFAEKCTVEHPEEWEPVTELNKGTSFEIEIGEYTLPTVDQFEMELPVVKAGDPVFSEDYECDDTDYTLSLTWHDEEGQKVEDVTFVAGNTYILQLLYTLKNGAVLAEDFTFLINDETYDEEIEISDDRTWAQLEITYVVKGEITPEITITALPEFKEGGAIADANVKLEVTGVPEGSVTAETQWQVWDTVEAEDEEGNSYEDWVEVTDDTFSATDVYRCFVMITAQGDYCFSEDYDVTCPEGMMIGGWGSDKDEDGNYTIIEIEIGEYTKTTVIDKVEVTASEVKAGNTASVDEIVYWSGNVEVTDGVNLYVYEWSEVSSGDSEPVTEFEKERNYQLDIELEAKEGYSFAADIEVYINGEVEDVTSDPCCVDICKSYSLLSPVDHVEIELPDVKEGEPIFEEVTIGCDCEDCEIAVDWSEIIGEGDEEITYEHFIAGKTYRLQLTYNNYSGAALSEDFVFIIDGVEYKATEFPSSTQANLELTYVIREIITPTIEITALPEIAKGGVIADANVTVEVSEALPGSVEVETQWQVWSTVTDEYGDEDEEYVPVTEETFSDTDVYYCVVVVTADSGYAFSEDCTVKCSEGVTISSWGPEVDNDGNITSVEIEIGKYTLTKVIDKVEVTASEVVEGNTASVGEIVCWAGDEEVTGFEIDEREWIDMVTYATAETFEREHTYQLQIELKAKKGYSFATEAAVYINDEKASYFSYPCHISLFEEYTLLTPVDHVEITDFSEVKEGAPIFTEVTLGCDCEKCELSVSWFDEDGEDVTDVFFAGNTYTLQLDYNNYSSAALSEDFVFIINGEKYEPTKLSAETGQAQLEIIYVIGKNVTVTAISRTLIDDVTVADITVKVDDATYTCEKQLPIGSEVTVSVTDENFINWLNKNGKIVTEEADYTFIVTGDVELTMSKKGTAGSSALVEFVSEYKQVMDSKIYTPQSDIVLPAGPSKLGWNFNKWSLTQEDIQAKIAAGETHIIVSPEYTPSEETYTVKVYVDEMLKETKSVGAADSEAMTVTAPEESGTKTFQYWREGETILGYDTSYSMRVSKDISIYAVYGNAAEEKKPVIAMTNVFTTDLNNKKKISFSVTRDVPDGYVVVEHGMLYNTSGMSPATIAETLVIGADGVNKYEYGTTAPKGVFTLNVDVTNKESTTVAARGYMIVKKITTEHEDIYYSDVKCRSYN